MNTNKMAKNKICWIVGILMLVGVCFAGTDYSVDRDMPSSAIAGETIHVDLDIQAANISALGLVIINPPFWPVNNVSCGGIVLEQQTEYQHRSWQGSTEWLFWQYGNQVGNYVCGYDITVPIDAVGSFSFPGMVYVDKDGIRIDHVLGGPNELTVCVPTTTTTTPTTTTTTTPISITGIVEDINTWADGDSISLEDLIKSINEWANQN